MHVRPHLLADFLFPPAHWAQFALPEVFLGRPRGAGDLYWDRYRTISGEACAYVGIRGLDPRVRGALAKPRLRGLAPWRVIVPLSLALATMPGWWPDGFLLLMQLPGLGWFRAPARYTLLTSLGLAFWPGGGSIIASHRDSSGRGFLAILVGAVAWAWSIYWTKGADFRSTCSPDNLDSVRSGGIDLDFRTCGDRCLAPTLVEVGRRAAHLS